MTRSKVPPPSAEPRRRGFEPAFGLISPQVRKAGESRGFAIARLITHWTEIVGQDIANATRPVKVSHRNSMGATLTLLIRGAAAPMIEMQKEQIRSKVNAVYGYNAVSRLVLTQTSATGFAEEQAGFHPAPPSKPPDPALQAKAARATGEIHDPELKSALEQLATNILTNDRKR